MYYGHVDGRRITFKVQQCSNHSNRTSCGVNYTSHVRCWTVFRKSTYFKKLDVLMIDDVNEIKINYKENFLSDLQIGSTE